MSFEFLKAENQFLETGLQTTTSNIFLEVIVRKKSFYKNSMDLNKTLVVEPIQLVSNSRFMSGILIHETPMVTS
jgi:hypothetical protein